MRIGIFGGSFDPPHRGHLKAVQNLLVLGKIDEIWFMPCYVHVWDKKLAPARHRLAMTRLLKNQKIKVSVLEIEQKKPVYTIETLKLLNSCYHQHQFFWIIGEKNLSELVKWKEAEKVKKQLLIVPEIPGICSSLIRQRIKQGKSIKNLVPAKVAAYIKKHGLYK